MPGEIHFSIETVATAIAIVAVIAPAAYMAGRFHQRLTTVEVAIEQTLTRVAKLALRIAEALERIASHDRGPHDR